MRGEKDREEDEDHGVFTTHESRLTGEETTFPTCWKLGDEHVATRDYGSL